MECNQLIAICVMLALGLTSVHSMPQDFAANEIQSTSCFPTLGACETSSQCCSGLCEAHNDPSFPQCRCYPTNEMCDTDENCCSLKCHQNRCIN